MTRRRSSAPGRDRSDRHRSLSTLLLPVVAALVVACGGAVTSGTPANESGTPTAGEATPSDDGTPGPETSEEPTESADDVESEAPETEEPTEEPSAEPTDSASAEPTDEASTDPGSASACTGTDENRDFYASVAAAVGWTVYCPVLPKGWFVESGQYRLAGGGRMEIGYRGPSGARITLHEGAFCSEADGCVPAGTEMGPSAFGDLDGTLIGADDGGWAVVVDAGQKPSWLIVGSSLDEAAFRKIAADLIAVGG